MTTYLAVQPEVAAEEEEEEEEEESDRQASKWIGVNTYRLWFSGFGGGCGCVWWSSSGLSSSGLSCSVVVVLGVVVLGGRARVVLLGLLLRFPPCSSLLSSQSIAITRLNPGPKPQAARKRHWSIGCPKAERFRPNFLSALRGPRTDATRDDIEMLLGWRLRSFPATRRPPEANGSERVTGEEVRRQNSSLASGA